MGAGVRLSRANGPGPAVDLARYWAPGAGRSPGETPLSDESTGAGGLGGTRRPGGVSCPPMSASPVAPNLLRRGLVEDRTSDACAIVIFGASGDLTRRK